MHSASLSFRKFPYPYRSMLAICSDLDETSDWPTYLEICRYLNTSDITKMGRGVGLDTGNTMYFDMPDGELSYWNVGAAEREQIRTLIRSGHIDCFHSFGDAAHERRHAERTLADLESHGCRLKVWVDHATAPNNFGADIMCGHGDEPQHGAYHADLTVSHGVRYIWIGRVTSIIGQNAPYDPLLAWSRTDPLVSLRTVLKDITKQTLSRGLSAKYRMHAGNRLTRPVTLRDGQQLTEFIRCNPHPGGVSVGDNAEGIATVLSKHTLDALVRRGGVSVIYTHLGKALATDTRFSPATCAAFERLADYARSGSILVTTTSRLLDFDAASRTIDAKLLRDGNTATVDIRLPDACAVDGITFYWDGDAPNVLVNGAACAAIQANAADETGRRSVSIPWKPLEWTL